MRSKVRNCKQCGEKLTGKYQKIFCSKGCAAKFNNIGVRRHPNNLPDCLNCGNKLSLSCRKFCDNSCQRDYQNKQDFQLWKEGKFKGNFPDGSFKTFLRRMIIEEAGYKCPKCNWGEFSPYTGKVPLEIHHKNGDAFDSGPNNIELLCPNCHALTENYKGLNSNSIIKRRNYKDK